MVLLRWPKVQLFTDLYICTKQTQDTPIQSDLPFTHTFTHNDGEVDQAERQLAGQGAGNQTSNLPSGSGQGEGALLRDTSTLGYEEPEIELATFYRGSS